MDDSNTINMKFKSFSYSNLLTTTINEHFLLRILLLMYKYKLHNAEGWDDSIGDTDVARKVIFGRHNVYLLIDL